MYTTTVCIGHKVKLENGKKKVVKDGKAFNVLRFSRLDLKDPAKTLAIWVKARGEAYVLRAMCQGDDLQRRSQLNGGAKKADAELAKWEGDMVKAVEMLVELGKTPEEARAIAEKRFLKPALATGVEPLDAIADEVPHKTE